MASVTCRNVYKRFGDFVAVEDLSIDIEDKEFVVFVGPSGCGKSTSLQIMRRELVMNQADPRSPGLFLTVIAIVALSRKRDRIAELVLRIISRFRQN